MNSPDPTAFSNDAMLISPETGEWAVLVSECLKYTLASLMSCAQTGGGEIEIVEPTISFELDGKQRFLWQVFFMVVCDVMAKPPFPAYTPPWRDSEMDFTTAWRMVDWFDRAHGPGRREVGLLIEGVLLIRGFVEAAVDGYLVGTGEENARYGASHMLRGNETPTLEQGRAAIAVARKLEGHEPVRSPES